MKQWLLIGLILTSCVSMETSQTFYNRGKVVKPHEQRPLYDLTPRGKRWHIQVITVYGFDTIKVWADEDWKENQIVKLK